jgi:hypothetical protein
VSSDRESMVVRRHEDGALEIVSQGTETQLISRDLLVEVVASLNQNLAGFERLRAERDAERALADQLADVLRIVVRDWCPSTVRVPILAAHAAARTNGSASATDVGGPS